MNYHQPFETWIFQENPLSEQEKNSLDQHLRECEHCRQLAGGWQTTRQVMRETPQLGPTPGFSQRWMASLSERRALAHQKQTRRFFKYLISFTLLSFLGLVFTIILGTSPLDLLSAVLHNGIALFLFIKQVQNILLVTFSSVPLIIPVVLWILVSTGFCLAVLVWGGAMWRYFIKGALQNEN